MSPSAILFLAAATTPVQADPPSRGAAVAEARASATIVAAAVVRQAGGLEQAKGTAPGHQVSRRGTRILVEFQ